MPRTLQALLAAMLLACATPAAAAPAPAKPANDAWKDEVIYFVLTDRFFNGDRQNDENVNAQDPFAYHGGDLAGLTSKLDYIKGLGATAIWLTPVSDNQDGPFLKKYWGYHGYWIENFDQVDEHLGDEAAFKRFVDAAHAKGLKVVLDAVVNHVGYDAPLAKDASKRDWFHHNGDITNWEDPYQNENFNLAGLPDFNSENKEVLAFHEKVWGDWQATYKLDGFRMDTVRHVSMPFWVRFNSAIKQRGGERTFMLGEVSYHTPRELAPYLRDARFDSLFDFPLSFTLVDVFAKGGSMRQLPARLKEDVHYPDAGMLTTFIDNHDYPRFLTVAGGDERKLKLALAAMMTLRGIPSIYYGTEAGMAGGKDPDNRQDMAWGAEPELTAYVKRLIALRHSLAALRRGVTTDHYVDDQAYAYTRQLGHERALVLLNNGNAPKVLTFKLAMREGTVLKNRLGEGRSRVTGGKLSVRLAPYEAQILTP